MGGLVVLEQRLLWPEDAKAVAPAQGQLEHRACLRVGGDLVVDGRDARIGEGKGQGQVLKENQAGTETGDDKRQGLRVLTRGAEAQRRG